MRIRRPAALAAGLLVVAFPVLAGGAFAGGGGGPSAAAAKHAGDHRLLDAGAAPGGDPARLRPRRQGLPSPAAEGKAGRRWRRRWRRRRNGLANTSGASWTERHAATVYTVTGKVYFVMGGQGYVCSGTAIANDRAGYAIVLTAGHCVYDETNGGGQLSGFATNWEFIPQFDSSPTFTCASTAYGCWTAQALVANSGFTNAGGFTTAATHYDWGFAVVGTGGRAAASSMRSGRSG